MMAAMERAGAVRLNAAEIDALTKAAIATVGEGEHKHDVPHKDFIGQDAAVLARAAGKNVPAEVEMLFGETDESNPFVPVEQMMPFVPFVRCRNVDEAIEKARAQRARLPPHGDHPLEQRPQHDQDGQGDGHDAVRQERPVHGRAGTRRRRILLVLDRRPDRRRRDHAADVHPRAPLLDDRRSANSGEVG